MDAESEIAQRLKQSIPQDSVYTPQPIVAAPVDTTQGQAKVAEQYKLDEMTQYKLHDLLGEQYQPTNDVAKQQVEFIYEYVAKMVDSPEYGYIAAKIREIERMIGTTDRPDRIYRLYQWIKLDNARKVIEAEQGALVYG